MSTPQSCWRSSRSSAKLLWCINGEECLLHTDLHDAVQEYMEQHLYDAAWQKEASPEDRQPPPTLECCEYMPRLLLPSTGKRLASWALERILEGLAEDYAFEDMHAEESDVPAPLAEALLAAVEAIAQWYPITKMEPTGKFVFVDTRDWVKEHRPEWLLPQERDHADV